MSHVMLRDKYIITIAYTAVQSHQKMYRKKRLCVIEKRDTPENTVDLLIILWLNTGITTSGGKLTPNPPCSGRARKEKENGTISASIVKDIGGMIDIGQKRNGKNILTRKTNHGN